MERADVVAIVEDVGGVERRGMVDLLNCNITSCGTVI